ncbi:MAG: thiamine-binding protein [Chloroflexi bacterium]|nr:thiamine-binding protein [Chloroflexota bacterium]
MDKNRTVTVSVQVLPLTDDAYPIVDRAIEAIAASGVTYEVGPSETTMEGPLDDLLAAAKAAHLACFEAGAGKVVTFIKIADAVEGTTIAEKTDKYRA